MYDDLKRPAEKSLDTGLTAVHTVHLIQAIVVGVGRVSARVLDHICYEERRRCLKVRSSV
jgi:hypothetical protein